jgi:hypothetical protein
VRKTVVLCDLDEEPDRRAATTTVEVMIDGAKRSVDVCAEHLAVLQSLPAAAIEKLTPRAPRRATAGAREGRRMTKPAVTRSGRDAAGARSRGREEGSRRSRAQLIAEARTWARAQGREIADRGRLPLGLLEEFEATKAGQ